MNKIGCSKTDLARINVKCQNKCQYSLSPCLLWSISLRKLGVASYFFGVWGGLEMSAVCWSTMGGEGGGGIGGTTSKSGWAGVGGVTSGLVTGATVEAGTSLASVVVAGQGV